jgi:hypothetical protein
LSGKSSNAVSGVIAFFGSPLFRIVHIPAGNATVPTGWNVKWAEHGLFDLCFSTYRTSVGAGQNFKGGSLRDPVLRFTPWPGRNYNPRLHKYKASSFSKQFPTLHRDEERIEQQRYVLQ